MNDKKNETPPVPETPDVKAEQRPAKRLKRALAKRIEKKLAKK